MSKMAKELQSAEHLAAAVRHAWQAGCHAADAIRAYLRFTDSGELDQEAYHGLHLAVMQLSAVHRTLQKQLDTRRQDNG